jgi:guanosine-3',5'-bis(diphosphate) 3'-pyrophosphohydrolase
MGIKPMTQKQIRKLIKSSKNPKLLEEAFAFAQKSHQDKIRFSGQPYIDHVAHVAAILQQMNLDEKTVLLGILHEACTELRTDQKTTVLKEISQKFGQDTAELVKKFSDIKIAYYPIHRYLKEQKKYNRENMENIRRMFFAIAKDLRIILVELASRIEGLQNIEKMQQEMQTVYATETLEIFVPIANRLGLGEIKTNLEDLAFKHLYPEDFAWLQENLKEKYEERQHYLRKFIPKLKKVFRDEKIQYVDINSRAKSYWSTYKKLLTHNMDVERIHDLVALRVIVKDIANCYRTLGIIHKHYLPVSSEEINDFIAKPKTNGYKALHTNVFLQEPTESIPSTKRISEIQIKTEQMHKDAEYGVCAHWSYKERVDLQKDSTLLTWSKEIPKFWQTLNVDFFDQQVFALTPKGDVVSLPKGSTPIDFAYAIHSDIGNHCEGAKIDGKIIPLTEPLKNGDIVEIITNKKKIPSQDWLRVVKTGFAKSNIKKIIATIPASLFSVPSLIKNKIVEFSTKTKKKKKEVTPSQQQTKPKIYLAGQANMMVTMAKCCRPEPGHHVQAYLTQRHSAMVHKTSCQNFQKLSTTFPEKVVEATWHES